MNEDKKQKDDGGLDVQTKNAAEETVKLMDEELDKVSGGHGDGSEPPPWAGEVG